MILSLLILIFKGVCERCSRLGRLRKILCFVGLSKWIWIRIILKWCYSRLWIKHRVIFLSVSGLHIGIIEHWALIAHLDWISASIQGRRRRVIAEDGTIAIGRLRAITLTSEDIPCRCIWSKDVIHCWIESSSWFVEGVVYLRCLRRAIEVCWSGGCDRITYDIPRKYITALIGIRLGLGLCGVGRHAWIVAWCLWVDQCIVIHLNCPLIISTNDIR